MIIDKKGKLFGKVSIIDILVVVVVIIGIAGVLMTKAKLDEGKILSNESNMLIKTSKVNDKMEIKLELKEVRDVTRDSIVVGDEVFMVSTDKVLGVVTSVHSKPAIRTVKGDAGEVYEAEVPERFDVTIVVETEGKKDNDGYYTNSNIRVLYGKDIEIKTSTVQTTPTVTDIILTENVEKQTEGNEN